MPGLIPTLAVTTTPNGVHVTCSHCDLEAIAPTRPAADRWALHHEKAHLLGTLTRED